MDKISTDAPPPRLCHLFKLPDFDGFGFNLHGEKNKTGQFIGKVDDNSPAELGGLKARDRIIEVNGTNIANENHKQVVERIKAIPNETKLLVVDEVAEEYYKSRGIIVTGDMPNVIVIQSPSKTVDNANVTDTDTRAMIPTTTPEQQMTIVKKGSESDEEVGSRDMSDTGSFDSSSLPSKTNSLKKKEKNGFSDSVEDDRSWEGVGTPSPSPITATPSPTPLNFNRPSSTSKGSTSSLDLNMTAQEMRAKLAARKADKQDIKNARMDLKQKYEIIQTL